MIKAKHTEPWNSFLQWYVRRKLRKHFAGPEVNVPGNPPVSSVLLLGNHFSWWDGFFALEASKAFFSKKLHVMMLEEELKKRKYLSHAGAFSIDPGNRSAIVSLNYAADLLSSDQNLLCLFPQGEMQPFYTHPVYFQKGWGRILELANPGFSIYFMVNIPIYGSDPKPLLQINLKPFDFEGDRSVASVETAFNEFLLDCLQKVSVR